ncbi:MAG: multicopper oxidase domain-containing protein [Moorea sp. SIO2I5]|nr:multicopper oxidase domain-containing protein [Moorena sp. SIO2I5]
MMWSRRQILQSSFVGLGIAGTVYQFLKSRPTATVKVPRFTTDEQLSAKYVGFDPINCLRSFDYGRVKQENGHLIREFEIVADNTPTQLNKFVGWVSWNFNNRVPGPTLRAVEGDRIRVIFRNQDATRHSIHFHGIHPAEMDGVTSIGLGKETVYEFEAKPYGVHLYHCHVSPVTRHISKGLYGMFIIDPPRKRPPADEMVLVMSGYDIDGDIKTEDIKTNELYAFNGLPDFYNKHPIPIYQNQLIRLYILNMIEYDVAVTFHIHANMFNVYPTGCTIKPTLKTDVITMGTAERHILEFAYPFPGNYMFHPHQDQIAENGCMGQFSVIPSNKFL